MRTHRRLSIMALVISTAAFAGACGSKSSNITLRPVDDESTTTVAAEPNGNSSPSTDANSPTSAPQTSSVQSDAPVDTPTVHTGKGPFCDSVAGFKNLDATATSSPDQSDPSAALSTVKKQLAQVGTSLHAMNDAAPAPVKADMATITAAYDEMIHEVDSATSLQALTDLGNQLTTAKVDTAMKRVEAFVSTSCGIDLSAPGGD